MHCICVAPPFVLYAMNEWLLCFPIFFTWCFIIVQAPAAIRIPFRSPSSTVTCVSAKKYCVATYTLVDHHKYIVVECGERTTHCRKRLKNIFSLIHFDIYGVAPATKSVGKSTMMMEKLRHVCVRT